MLSPAPEISVVVPLYNKERYIFDCISSALGQSFDRFELIVVDDGSTDESAGIVEAMSFPNLRLIRQSNRGVSAARNRGIRAASSDWVAFLDSDDLWMKDHLSELWSTRQAYPQAALVANRYSRTSASSFSATNVHRRMTNNFIDEAARGETWIFTSAAMVRKDVALAIGAFAEGENRGEDVDLWVRLALQHPVAFSSYLGTIYRQVSNSLTSSVMVLEPDVAMRTISSHIAANQNLAPELRLALRELFDRLALSHASDCLMSGHRKAARAFIALSHDTHYWSRRRYALYCLSLFPTWFVRTLATVKRMLQ